MTVCLVQINKNEPTYYESGKTISDLLQKLDVDGRDPEGFIAAIQSSDLSGAASKFEIRSGVWVLFT